MKKKRGFFIMGLDMYAYKVSKKDVINDFKFKQSDDVIELDYWRKHHDLHGWFENLYHLKGGAEVFNLIPLKLEIEDLDQLEEDIKNRKLPHTTGFCFGDNPPDNESDKYDLEFIEKARKAIQDGYAVYYNSWW